MPDVDVLADSVFKAVESYLARSLDEFTKRVDDIITKRLEALPKPKDGEPGKDGRDGQDADIQKLVAVLGPVEAMAANALEKVGAVEKQILELPTPKDGVDGKDAIVDYEKIAEDMAKAIEGLPKPKDGIDGKDATIDYIYLAKEMTHDVPEFMECVKHIVEPLLQHGKDGKDGKDAEIDYVKVADIVKEQVDALPKPKDGKDGRDGRDAKDGRDGEPGKDALEAKILRDIDPSRSYAKGTYAIYDGAWIQAKRVTGPISDGLEAAGWEVLLEYPSIVQMGFADDLRTFTVVAKTATGKRIEETVKIPVVLDRGVWKEGNYERGDAVTSAGSMWIAQCDTKESPGISADWRLSVKRGRDGKDGRILEPVAHRPVTLR